MKFIFSGRLMMAIVLMGSLLTGNFSNAEAGLRKSLEPKACLEDREWNSRASACDFGAFRDLLGAALSDFSDEDLESAVEFIRNWKRGQYFSLYHDTFPDRLASIIESKKTPEKTRQLAVLFALQMHKMGSDQDRLTEVLLPAAFGHYKLSSDTIRARIFEAINVDVSVLTQAAIGQYADPVSTIRMALVEKIHTDETYVHCAVKDPEEFNRAKCRSLASITGPSNSHLVALMPTIESITSPAYAAALDFAMLYCDENHRYSIDCLPDDFAKRYQDLDPSERKAVVDFYGKSHWVWIYEHCYNHASDESNRYYCHWRKSGTDWAYISSLRSEATDESTIIKLLKRYPDLEFSKKMVGHSSPEVRRAAILGLETLDLFYTHHFFFELLGHKEEAMKGAAKTTFIAALYRCYGLSTGFVESESQYASGLDLALDLYGRLSEPDSKEAALSCVQGELRKVTFASLIAFTQSFTDATLRKAAEEVLMKRIQGHWEQIKDADALAQVAHGPYSPRMQAEALRALARLKPQNKVAEK